MQAEWCTRRGEGLGRRKEGGGIGGGRSVVTFSEEEGEGRFMIVESDIGREIFRFIAFARNKRKISDSYKRGY